jgi:hypothetical protein
LTVVRFGSFRGDADSGDGALECVEVALDSPATRAERRRRGEATVVQLGKTVAFMEGELRDEAGCLLATATANARLVETGKAIG